MINVFVYIDNQQKYRCLADIQRYYFLMFLAILIERKQTEYLHALKATTIFNLLISC